MKTPPFDRRASSAARGEAAFGPARVGLSPRALLAAVLAECTRSRRERGGPAVAASVDVSVRHDVPLAFDAAALRRVLEPLVRRALESAAAGEPGGERPPLREVMVSGIDMGDAFEIEVADSGPALSGRLRQWLGGGGQGGPPPEEAGLALAAARMAAARLGGSLVAVNCPDGGVAITLRLPRRQAVRLAA